MADKKAEALKIVEDEAEILSSFSTAEHEAWFDGNIHHYKTLAAMVAATLKSALDGHGISYVDIPYREKAKKSFLKKLEDKKKKKDYLPSDMTDLAGIRVITLIESDIQKVSDLIHQMFNVHKEDSVNKTESLGEDKVGYRSVHFVCDIGESREGLPEWKFLKGCCFEVQVRTALMHAWAEIEHDRGYKLGGKLPSNLARRFSLLSGLLESADLEFNRLTVEIEEYAKSLDSKIDENLNLNVEITSVGIKKLIEKKYNQYCILNSIDLEIFNDEEIINELIAFDINNLETLDKTISNSLVYLTNPDSNIEESLIGFLRNIMLLTDIDKYFEESWIKNKIPWGYIDMNSVNLLERKYGKSKVNSIFKKYKIKIEDNIFFSDEG